MNKRFNYCKFILFCLIVLSILFGIVYLIISITNNIKYKKTNEYKLVEKGYKIKDTKEIEKYLNDNEIKKVISIDYNKNIVCFIKNKYFMFKNLDMYLDYYKNNSKYECSKVISIINTGSNIDWIDEERETDVSQNDLMMVNRLYGLSSDFEPDDIVDVPLKYAYSNKKIKSSILDSIINLITEAKDYGYTFVVSSGYRSYKEQEKLYNSYADSYGKSEADEYVAKPGHSEYQTGLTFDLEPYNKVFENSFESEEYEWLSNNSYKYGFIIRLPKGKEDITRFSSSAWKLRYVGIEAAKRIYEENTTFEEYYAYYVEGDK